MSIKTGFFSLVFILLVSCNNHVIVDKGDTEYTILLENGFGPSESRAALLLQHYVQKISGVVIPIDSTGGEVAGKRIIMSRNDNKYPDGYSVVSAGDDINITGGNHKGSIYGVIHLLEDYLGCRKYSPDFEVIPEMNRISLPKLNDWDQPENQYRIINGRFCQDSDYQDWQRLDLIQDRFADGYYVHTFNRLLPWQEYFEDHPEYFAYQNGKRIIDQLCLTNPDVLRIVTEKLEEEMALQPDKTLWSVSQNDNFSFCQCEECSKVIVEEGSPAGPIIRFVNEIARRFPDKTISTLAYQYSRQAPQKTAPESNVQIMLCTIELNRSMPIARDERSASFVKDIQDWGKLTHNIYLWDYTVNFSHHVTPFPNIHVLQPNIQFFFANNVFNHFQQSNTDTGHEFSELKSYLISRLLWNPDANAREIIEDFMNGYYGDGGIYVHEYQELLQEEILRTGEWLDIYGHPTAHENTFLSEENITRYLDLFDRALQAVVGDSARTIHVRTALLPVQYAAMEIGKNHMFDERGWYALKDDAEESRIENRESRIENPSEYILRPEMRDMLDMFIETCRLAGVHTLNEAGLTPEVYYQATRRSIQIEVDKNLAFRKSVTADPPASEKYGGGDLSYLTNGVKGANDYKVHWLGWEAQNFTLMLDEGKSITPDTIQISTLYDPKSWIFHPVEVSCERSTDGQSFEKIGTLVLEGDQRDEGVTRTWRFDPGGSELRYIRFYVKGTLHNPEWHPSAGGDSWVFVDEIVVK